MYILFNLSAMMKKFLILMITSVVMGMIGAYVTNASADDLYVKSFLIWIHVDWTYC